MIAMRELLDLPWMDRDRLRNVQLDALARTSEDFSGEFENEGLQDEVRGPARPAQ